MCSMWELSSVLLMENSIQWDLSLHSNYLMTKHSFLNEKILKFEKKRRLVSENETFF